MGTYSYNQSDLGSYGVDWIRFQVQDGDSGNWLLSNEEIAQCLASERNAWGAAAQAAEVIARGFLRKQDVKLGRAMTIAYATAAKQYLEMSTTLRRKANATVIPFVGGMSKSVKFVYSQDSDIYPAIFVKRMQESPWTGGYSPDALGPYAGGTDDAGFPFT